MNIERYEKVEKYLGSFIGDWRGISISLDVMRNTYTMTAAPDTAWLRTLKKDRRLGVTYWDGKDIHIGAFADQDDVFANEEKPSRWKIWAYSYDALCNVLEHIAH